MAKLAVFAKRLKFEFLLSRDHRIKGGFKDTELNELTVKPYGVPSGFVTVTMVTPVR